MEFLLLGAAGSASGLFKYNRKNFQFDNDLRMEKTFQGMEMAIKQFELYREDVRDLVELTVKKMDNYLVVNTLQLGFAVTMFTEGRPEGALAAEEPRWLMFLCQICNLASFMYYLLSMWLAMHASVAAHSFGVRLLTQFVRLPVPSSRELDEARALSKDYEAQGVKDLFRVPVWKQQMARMQKQLESESSDDNTVFDGDIPDEQTNANPVARLQHIQQFRRLQANWQSYDAYARVSMALGTNMTMMSFSYYCLGLLTVENSVPWSAFSTVVIFVTTAWVLARLDLYLPPFVLAMAGCLIALPPLLAVVCCFLAKTEDEKLREQAGGEREAPYVPIIFALHVLWASFCLAIAQADHMTETVALPTKFRSVLYLDVFGWLREDKESRNPDAADLDDNGVRRNDLSTVQESHVAPSADASGQPTQLPRVALERVVERCAQMREDIDQELQCWEAPDVQRMMQDQPQFLQFQQENRARFNLIRDQFKGLVDGLVRDSKIDRSKTEASPKSARPVWLKLQWSQPNGDWLPYYYNRNTSGTWMPPTPEARPGGGTISDLEGIDESLDVWVDNISALVGGTNSVQQAAAARTPRVGGGQNDGDQGAEMITTHRVQTHIQRRPVGRMPWHTFWQGTAMLIFVWCLATVWSIAVCISGGADLLHPVEHGHEHHGNETHDPSSSLFSIGGPSRKTMVHPTLTKNSDWPHAFFRPSSLTCDPSAGLVGLMADNYGVYEVDLHGAENNQLAGEAVRPALSDCLAEARSFIGRGLASISLKCFGGSSPCTAVLLSNDGKSLLQCNLVTGESKRSSALGGNWNAIAAGPDDAFWALGNEAIVQMKPLAGTEQLMPHFDIPLGRVGNLTDVHMHGDWLLGLQSDGFLHAWSLSGESVHRYRLPRDVKWTGACSTAEVLHLTGMRDGKAGLWHVDMPDQLSRAAPTPPSKWMRWFVAR